MLNVYLFELSRQLMKHIGEAFEVSHWFVSQFVKSNQMINFQILEAVASYSFVVREKPV